MPDREQSQFGHRVLAFSALLIVMTFMAVAWLVVIISMWSLAVAPDAAEGTARMLLAPVSMLLVGSVGALGASALLFGLVRRWTTFATSGASFDKNEIWPAETVERDQFSRATG